MVKEVKISSTPQGIATPFIEGSENTRAIKKEITKIALQALILGGISGTLTWTLGLAALGFTAILTLGNMALVAAGAIGVAIAVSAVALAILHSSNLNKNLKKAIQKHLSPIENPVPPSAASAVKPVGIVRPEGSNNCCMNVFIQGFMMIPSWQKALENIEVCQSIASTYNQAQIRRQSTISEDVSKNLRNYLGEKYLSQHSSIVSDKSLFTDSILSDENQNDLDALDLIELSLQEADPNLKAACAASLLSLPNETQEDPREILEDLLEKAHTSLESPQVDIALKEESNDFLTLLEESKPNLFKDSPSEFLIFIAPFLENGEKNLNPIESESFIQEIKKEETTYICDYYVMHAGESGLAGHYVCGVYRDGKWYHINDDEVFEMDRKTAETEIRQARMLHYRKLES